MEIIHHTPATPVSAVLFDFDGTISTLRFGWDAVMRQMMLELIPNRRTPDAQLITRVDAYLDESAGIQTIYQMKWLAEQVQAFGATPNAPTDPWLYKDDYNERLMRLVKKRIEQVASGEVPAEQYLVGGARALLSVLKARGIPCYVASGTDDCDVRREAHVLGVDDFFERIAGAPLRVEGCAKEAALRGLIADSGLRGADIAVIGDGKVEIALAKSIGARALGLASDEAVRHGVNPLKRTRLMRAGADAITGDYLEADAWMAWLGL
ncbi:MAG: HAD family hydrolase [Clostridia bacterium]